MPSATDKDPLSSHPAGEGELADLAARIDALLDADQLLDAKLLLAEATRRSRSPTAFAAQRTRLSALQREAEAERVETLFQRLDDHLAAARHDEALATLEEVQMVAPEHAELEARRSALRRALEHHTASRQRSRELEAALDSIEEARLRGALDEASDLLERTIDDLGAEKSLLDLRQELAVLRRERREAEVRALVDRAEGLAANGEHANALKLLAKAALIDPENLLVREETRRVEGLREKALRAKLRASRAAETVVPTASSPPPPPVPPPLPSPAALDIHATQQLPIQPPATPAPRPATSTSETATTETATTETATTETATPITAETATPETAETATTATAVEATAGAPEGAAYETATALTRMIPDLPPAPAPQPVPSPPERAPSPVKPVPMTPSAPISVAPPRSLVEMTLAGIGIEAPEAPPVGQPAALADRTIALPSQEALADTPPPDASTLTPPPSPPGRLHLWLAVVGAFGLGALLALWMANERAPASTAGTASGEEEIAVEDVAAGQLATGTLALAIEQGEARIRIIDAAGNDLPLPPDSRTPLTLELPPGHYQVVLSEPAGESTRTYEVEIEAGQRHERRVAFP